MFLVGLICNLFATSIVASMIVRAYVRSLVCIHVSLMLVVQADESHFSMHDVMIAVQEPRLVHEPALVLAEAGDSNADVSKAGSPPAGPLQVLHVCYGQQSSSRTGRATAVVMTDSCGRLQRQCLLPHTAPLDDTVSGAAVAACCSILTAALQVSCPGLLLSRPLSRGPSP